MFDCVTSLQLNPVGSQRSAIHDNPCSPFWRFQFAQTGHDERLPLGVRWHSVTEGAQRRFGGPTHFQRDLRARRRIEALQARGALFELIYRGLLGSATERRSRRSPFPAE
jgi:hypothetical protein